MVRLVILLLSVAVVSCAPVCKKEYYCADEGSNCTGDWNLYDPESNKTCDPTKGTCCALDTQCVKGVCVRTNSGSKCSNNSECFGPAHNNLLNICVNSTKCMTLQNAGDSCDEATQNCYGNLKCVEGKCVGNKPGHPCVEPFMVSSAYIIGQTCEYGYYCNVDNYCNATLPRGANCSTDTVCQAGLFCNQQNGTCDKLFSVDEKGACEDNFYCKVGLACVDNFCVKGEALAALLTTCEYNQTCHNLSGECLCNKFVGQYMCAPTEQDWSLMIDCNQQASEFFTCASTSGCPSIYPTTDSNSCVFQKCRDQVITLLKCQSCSGYPYAIEYGYCYSNICEIPMYGWEKLVILVSAILGAVIIVVAIVIVCKYKKKPGYTEVPT